MLNTYLLMITFRVWFLEIALSGFMGGAVDVRPVAEW